MMMVMEMEMDSHGGLKVTIRQTEVKKKNLPNNFVAQTSDDDDDTQRSPSNSR